MTESFEDRDALAADFALGVLDRAERTQAQALYDRDPAFARLVDDWNERLAPMSEAIPPVEPPPEVWQHVQARILADAPLIAERRQTPPPPPRPSIFARVTFWRWTTAMATAAAIVLGGLVALDQQIFAPDGDRNFVAVLDAAGEAPAWLVTVNIDTRELTIRPVSDMATQTGSHELWVIQDAESPPRSLGVLNPEAPLVIPVSDALDKPGQPAATLAISLEPAGGSPTGLPTGPVVYQGRLIPVAQD